jgi:hypothetical protein
MATAATIKKNIAKLEAALKSKATPKSLKSKLETQLVKSKAELSGINKGSKPKTSTSKSAQTALQKLKEMVNKNKKLKTYKKSGVDLEKDADRPALPIGRRTAKQSGKTYYEYRANRIDVKQPPKRYPKLEKGGRVDDFSDKIQEGDIVWDSGNNSYGVVLNTYDFKYGEIRLDSDGNQPEENLHKLGSKGDKGTKEKLKSALLAHKSLITKYPEMGYEKVNYAKGGEVAAKKRLEELREELRAERISYGELAELQELSEYIDKDDVELLEAAGVPENDEDEYGKGGKIRSQEEFNELVIKKEKLVKNLSPKEIADMWNKNSNSPSKMTEEEAKMSTSKMYLRDLLVEKELTKAEYDKYFEKGGYMAKGGAIEHGLKVGDTIIDDMFFDNSVKVLNNKTGYAVVHLETGERKEMKAMGGEMHRTQE